MITSRNKKLIPPLLKGNESWINEFLVYQLVHHCAVEALAVSIACLQVAGRVALPCGVDAAALKPLRCPSNACFMLGATWGFFAAIDVRQASYFVMYSSHSGTPVFGADESVFAVSLLDVVVLVVVVVDVLFAGFAFVVVFVVFVVAPPQPKETTANASAAAITRILLIFMG